jgi:glycerate 2-kinase
MTISHKALLREMFDAAVAAAQPDLRVPKFLPEPPAGNGRTIVIGAGKASAAMARAFEENWVGEVSGLVVTRYGYEVPCREIEIVEASHPVPDLAGETAARRIIEMVHGLGPDDLVVCLISGGGSALLSLSGEGLTLEDKQEVNRELLRCGATIHEMNCLRKHLSAVKGGRLAAAVAPARLVNLLISDVPGDDPAVIASGPTVPDPTTFDDARAIVRKYGIQLPSSVTDFLAKAEVETPKPGDPVFDRVETQLIALPMASLEAAAAVAENAGYRPVILGDALEGEARELGADHAMLAKKYASGDGKADLPCVLLSGGETTVTLKNTNGRGGRNTEYLLGMAVSLGGAPGISVVACDTDGVDGSEDNAGAMVFSDTLSRADKQGLDIHRALAENQAYGFFEGLGDLVVSGPTLTNVNDFRAIIVDP